MSEKKKMLKGRRPLSKQGQIFLVKLELANSPAGWKRLNIFLVHLHWRPSADVQMARHLRVQPRERVPALRGLTKIWNGPCGLLSAAGFANLGARTRGRAKPGKITGT